MDQQIQEAQRSYNEKLKNLVLNDDRKLEGSLQNNIDLELSVKKLEKQMYGFFTKNNNNLIVTKE